MLDLLLFGLVNSDRPSTRAMEAFYNSELFEGFSSKDRGHRTRHTSIADRLKTISPAYFKAIFEWAHGHFFDRFGGSKWQKKLKRFDSTMITVSSALVDWGMRVGKAPKDGPRKLQLKVTMGLKGLFPGPVRIHKDQDRLSEEKALYGIIMASTPEPGEIISFDAGLRSRQSMQTFDEQNIKFVTKGLPNLRYKVVGTHDREPEGDRDLRVLQDSIVHLYGRGRGQVEHGFRLVEVQVRDSGKTIYFLTNDREMDALAIAQVYRRRWDIEVFFRFIKQELNIEHLLSHSFNGVKVQIYTALLLAILLTVYTVSNKLTGYKIPKIMFRDELIVHIAKQLAKGEKLLERKPPSAL